MNFLKTKKTNLIEKAKIASPFFSHKKNKKKTGFTLIEMLISISLFTVVTTIALSALFSILKANDRSRVVKTAINNLSVAMESMTRELRVGHDYRCVDGGTFSGDLCGGGAENSGISFTSSKGDVGIKYILEGNNIKKVSGSGADVVESKLVSDEVSIDKLKFYIVGEGSESGPQIQPRVLIIIKGSVTDIKNGDKSFEIQTTVSQRNLDV